MRDGITLVHLKTFIACVDEGSFSAAARRLHRAQSLVSDLVSGLETQMGVQLFDRSARHPKLTSAGMSLLADVRGVLAGVDLMKARAKGIASGLESGLSAVVDVLFPIGEIAGAANEFQKLFPGTPLRLVVEALGGGYQGVLDGSVGVGIVPTLPTAPAPISREPLAGVPCVMVAARLQRPWLRQQFSSVHLPNRASRESCFAPKENAPFRIRQPFLCL
jgi:DNA-binding transcriptional LysR family regulator